MQSEVLLDHLYMLMRQLELYGAGHPSVTQVAEAAAREIAAGTLPVSLQAVAGFVFCDGRLVPLDQGRFTRAQTYFDALSASGAHELTIDRADAAALASSLSDFSAALVARADLEARRFGVVSARRIEGAKRGEATEDVDPVVFAASQIALCVADAEALVEGEEWDVQLALSLARRLESSWTRTGHLSFAVIERAPGEWSVARRVVSAALSTTGLLASLDVGRSLRRAAVHTATVLAALGFREEHGQPFADAVSMATERITDLPLRRGRLDPHRQRVLTLLADLAQERDGRRLALGGAVELTYGLERERVRGGLVLDSLEIMAIAANHMGRDYEPGWVRAYINLRGELPAGAPVALPDGRRGVVLGQGAVAGAYQLLVDGSLVNVRERPQWLR